MENRKIGKKADISSKWLVTMILLLAGFGILLYVLFRFQLGETINKEVCHESVVFRATAGEITGGLGENYVPLKCKTAKYCITTGLVGGKCDGKDEKGKAEAFAGEKGITKVKVKNVKDINRFLAREIVDCWSMMGEGKVSLFTQFLAKTYGISKVYPSCVICSRVAFDEKKLKEAGIKIESINVLDYMMRHKMPNKELTYFDYLTGEKGKIGIKPDLATAKKNLRELKEDKGFDVKGEQGKEKVDEFKKMLDGLVNEVREEKQEQPKEAGQVAILFMQIAAPEYLTSLKNIGLTLAGSTLGSFVFAPVASAKAVIKVVGLAIMHPLAAAILVISGVAIQRASVYLNMEVTAGYCGDVSVGKEARSGCSVVRATSYDLEDISRYCSAIESIP